MDCRGVLLIGAVIGAGALASSTACSGPDPGAITFAERQSQGGGDTSSGGSSGTSGTPADGGGTPDGTAPDPIFGTTAFEYQDPGVKANDVAAHGGSVEGRNCADMGCHVTGGAAAGKLWVFAGTVYSTAQGGAVVPKAEVRVVGPNGAEIGSAYTDENGNFWLEKDGTTIPADSQVGVRREGGTPMRMATRLQPDDRGCARGTTCHGGTGIGRIYAP